jgi:hypothetical protein
MHDFEHLRSDSGTNGIFHNQEREKAEDVKNTQSISVKSVKHRTGSEQKSVPEESPDKQKTISPRHSRSP